MLQTEDQVLPVMQEKRALKRQKEEAAYNLMFQKYAQQPLPPVEQGEGDVLDGEDSQDSPRLGLEQTMEDGEDSQDSPRLGLEQMETQIKSIVTSRSRGVSFAPDLPFARDYTPDLDIRSHCRSSIQTVDMESEEMLKEWTLNKSNNFNDSKSNRSFINSFRRRKETVLEGNSLVKRAWMEYLFYIGLALVIQMSLGRDFAFPDGRPACDNKFGSSTTNRLMCDLVWTLERAQGQLRFLAPFILGGFVVGTVQLWRLRRTAYAALCGATRNMNIQIASLVPLNSEDEKSVNARAMMARWSLLGYEFSVLKARGQMDTLDAKKHLQSLGLLADGEWEAMVSGDRHTTVWLWLQVKAVQLGEQKIITSDIHVQTICNAVTLIRDKANDMMSVIDRDQPFPYTSVCGILVNFNLLLTALWKGVEWAIMFYDEGISLYATPKMYVEIFLLFAYTMLFGLLYDLCHTLYNPFGPRSVDIPHKVVGGGIRRMSRRFSKGCTPPTTESSSNKGAGIAVDMGDGEEEVVPPLYPSRVSIFGVHHRRGSTGFYSH